jgi:hypothetical protein
MKDATDSLTRAAAGIAMRAAATYLDKHGLKVADALIVEQLRATIPARFREAIADAREAIDLGMTAVGEETFAASMVLAGIDAAKEAAAAVTSTAR